MRPMSLFVVALLAAAVGGCASLPASTGADTPSASAADLDSLAYERPLSPAAAPAQAQAQAQAPVTPAAAFAAELPYTLDTGDKLRVVVFGQDSLSYSYVVDASGAITMPLIKAVPARGLSTAMLARAV